MSYYSSSSKLGQADSTFRDESSAKKKQRKMSAKRAEKLYNKKVV